MFKSFLKCRLFFTNIVIFFLITQANVLAKVGLISNVNGSASVIDTNGKLKKVGYLESIEANQVMIINKTSSATIILEDKTVINISGPSRLLVNQFKNDDDKKELYITISDGKFNIQSGQIAKSEIGNMTLKFKEAEIKVSGILIFDLNNNSFQKFSSAELPTDNTQKNNTLEKVDSVRVGDSKDTAVPIAKKLFNKNVSPN